MQKKVSLHCAFNDYFTLQCLTVNTGIVIPQNSTVNVAKLSSISITDYKILDIIRSLKPNKAHGWYNVSVRMIKHCDSALVFPLKLIFLNFLLNPSQSGYRPRDSAVSQLLSITQTIHSAFDCDPTLDISSVFLDI